MTKGLYLANHCTYGRARAFTRLCRYITHSGVSDKRLATLNPVSGNTFCGWKGVAQYFDLITQQGSAWTYKNPTETFKPIAGYIAFYAGKVDEAWVGDVRVIPQPGDVYGGWVTPNLEGKIKGASGTNHW